MSKKQIIIAISILIALVILYSPLTSGMNLGTTALLKGAAGTGLAGIIGYLVMMQLKVFISPTNAKDYAKIWFGYIFGLLCVIRLNSFFISLEIEYLAQFTILIIVYGALAGISGYVFGKLRLRNNS
jgi:hypothetical protein